VASVIFARNEKVEIDCNRLFKRYAGPDARGGGKPHFVTGIIKKEIVNDVLDRIASEVLHQ
jgi:hypothetical protein